MRFLVGDSCAFGFYSYSYILLILTLHEAVGSSALILITSSAEGKYCLILCSSTSLSNVIILTPALAANLIKQQQRTLSLLHGLQNEQKIISYS